MHRAIDLEKQVVHFEKRTQTQTLLFLIPSVSSGKIVPSQSMDTDLLHHVETHSGLHQRAYQEVVAAADRIQGHVEKTPAVRCDKLAELGASNCTVHLKLETDQVTGSFKARGAVNKVLSLEEKELESTVTTASTGNHALATAYALGEAAKKGKAPKSAVIFVPNNVSEAKLSKLKQMQATVEMHGEDCVQTERYAREQAEKAGGVFISPYNDLRVIGGQGTIGKEVMEQVPDVTDILVPVGGGGLISGVAAWCKAIKPEIRIWACQPEASACMMHSITAGRILKEDEFKNEPTLSSAAAGGIETDSITFHLCKELIDEFVVLEEAEIQEAMNLVHKAHDKNIEGAAALPIAAFLKSKDRFAGKNVVMILSGANTSPE